MHVSFPWGDRLITRFSFLPFFLPFFFYIHWPPSSDETFFCIHRVVSSLKLRHPALITGSKQWHKLISEFRAPAQQHYWVGHVLDVVQHHNQPADDVTREAGRVLQWTEREKEHLHSTRDQAHLENHCREHQSAHQSQLLPRSRFISLMRGSDSAGSAETFQNAIVRPCLDHRW